MKGLTVRNTFGRHDGQCNHRWELAAPGHQQLSKSNDNFRLSTLEVEISPAKSMCAKSPTSERWRQIIIGVAAGVADKYTNLPSTKTEDLIREAKVCNDAIDASGLGKTKGVVSLRQYFDTKVTSIISYNSQIKTMAAKLGNEGSIAF